MVATASSFTNSRYIACPAQGSDGGVRINYNGYYSTGVLLCGGMTVFTCTHLFSLMARPHVPISKIISRYAKSLANCSLIAKIADRSYLYDNSVDGDQARLLFRVTNGILLKPYGPINPWAQEIASLLCKTQTKPQHPT